VLEQRHNPKQLCLKQLKKHFPLKRQSYKQLEGLGFLTSKPSRCYILCK